MAGWSERVRIVPGNEGYAYAPGQLLVRRRSLSSATNVLGLSPIGGDDIDGGDGGAPEEFVVLHYSGDIPSAVRQLRAVGIDAQPNHVYFASAHPGSIGASSVQGNPVYANPVYANPVYANPVYANPVYANPVYANPVYANAGVIGFVAGCPGGAHCCDHDPCTCPSSSGSASLVYPHPIYAGDVYDAPTARRFQLNGLRRTSATPAYVYDNGRPARLANAPWATAPIRVSVLDTGWPLQPRPAQGKKPNGAAAIRERWHSNADVQPAKRMGTEVADRDGDGRLDPATGHGMFIAGIIHQYAPGVAVEVIHVLNPEGDGDEKTIADAISELARRPAAKRPHLINLSFGTYTLDEPICIREATRAAQRVGIVVVAAAGNDGRAREQYPAALPDVVSVGALGPDGPAPFSNWGSWVRACAPGVDIVSGFWEFDGDVARPGIDDPERFEMWATWSGTSFAAPIVVAALAREMQLRDITARDAVQRVIDRPALHRIRCLGTVVNPGYERADP